MRIGISLTTRYPASVGAREGGRWLIERTRAARQAGLDSLFVGDHHSTGPARYFQNVPTMARLLAEWGDRTAGILALIPLWNPVLLAEQIGTLAAFAEGPFVLQCSLGDGADQFDALGVSIRRRPSLFEHHLTAIQGLLAGEFVEGARIAPVPEEPVQYWVGAMADAGVRRAAALADGFLATPGAPVEDLAERAHFYRQACREAGRAVGTIATRRDIYVGENAEEAQRTAAEVISRGYRGFSPDVLVIGSSEQVAAQFRDLREAGYSDVIVRHLALAQANVVASTERLADVRALLAG